MPAASGDQKGLTTRSPSEDGAFITDRLSIKPWQIATCTGKVQRTRQARNDSKD
jgi:hypothetical protein